MHTEINDKEKTLHHLHCDELMKKISAFIFLSSSLTLPFAYWANARDSQLQNQAICSQTVNFIALCSSALNY